MNIKINKEQANQLFSLEVERYIIGSKLYQINDNQSDTDILVIYKSEFSSDGFMPNYHQFQYDDIENNIQYIFTSVERFWSNLFSGDSTINADVILFDSKNYYANTKINLLKTYNIIKAYCGFSKRDIKQFPKLKSSYEKQRKAFHIIRSITTAEDILKSKIDKEHLEYIINFANTISRDENLINNKQFIEEWTSKEKEVRELCNDQYNKGIITLYPDTYTIANLTQTIYNKKVNDLELELIKNNNTKEFRYGLD